MAQLAEPASLREFLKVLGPFLGPEYSRKQKFVIQET